MECEKYCPLLSEYQEEELDKKLSGEIENHLVHCKKCKQELNALRKISSLAGELPRYAPKTETMLKIKSIIYGQTKTWKKTEFGPVLDIEELSEFLRVDQETIGLYLEEIPCFELGGKVLFRRESIEEWIAGKEKGLGSQITESRLNRILHMQDMEGGKIWKI